jgi:hypothetical protein
MRRKSEAAAMHRKMRAYTQLQDKKPNAFKAEYKRRVTDGAMARPETQKNGLNALHRKGISNAQGVGNAAPGRP